MSAEILVKKASGLQELFSVQKLRNSLSNAKASEEEIDSIVERLMPKMYQGISTKKIYTEAFRLLRRKSKSKAARYHLKKGIMELGPSGFPFERFVAELFKHNGYSVEVGVILKGKCVTHEVDVLAKKDKEVSMVECKYRNQQEFTVDVKIPLYINSRFDDLLANGYVSDSQVFKGWIATNARFTTDAIAYATCKGIGLIGWDFPAGSSLKNMIDESGLFPLTCLSSLTQQEKQWLLSQNYVLVKDIYKNENLLRAAGIKDLRLKTIRDEGEQLTMDS